MEIVVNRCFGGFSISRKCALYMERLGSKKAKAELDDWRRDKKYIAEFKKTGEWNKECKNSAFLAIDVKYKCEPTFHGYGYSEGFDGYDRTDPMLIAAVKSLKNKANGSHSKLEVVEIPDDVEWEIEEYDGMESIHEKHRSW